jgi:hypothetical protein
VCDTLVGSQVSYFFTAVSFAQFPPLSDRGTKVRDRASERSLGSLLNLT